MKKIIIQFTCVMFIMFFLFKYNYQVKTNLIIIFNFFINNIIPSMFPIIFITNYIKYNINNRKIIRFISLMCSYAPSNAIISINNNEILYSTVINPLFSYVILKQYFSISNTLLIIIINLIINYTLLYRHIEEYNNYNENTYNISLIIKETMMSIINILGVIIFFNIVITLLSIFISKYVLILFEITNGFNIISTLNIIKIRNILLIFLNSFCGIAIFFQIKSINNDASYLLIIKKFIISIIVTIVTIIIINIF